MWLTVENLTELVTHILRRFGTLFIALHKIELIQASIWVPPRFNASRIRPRDILPQGRELASGLHTYTHGAYTSSPAGNLGAW